MEPSRAPSPALRGLWVLPALLACGLLDGGGQKAPLAPELNSQSYDSPNGLITIHYPASFAAKVVGKSALKASRNLKDGRDEAVTFVSVDQPISNDLREFARVVELATVKKLGEIGSYQEASHTDTRFADVDGIETRGVWTARSGHRYRRWACAFLKDGHGYHFTYLVPEEEAATEEVTMTSILKATDFKARPASGRDGATPGTAP